LAAAARGQSAINRDSLAMFECVWLGAAFAGEAKEVVSFSCELQSILKSYLVVPDRPKRP